MTPARLSLALLLAGSVTAFAAGKGPLPIAEVQRTEPVNFERDLLPFLNDNCLACHCKTTTKGGLNLETPELAIKGGETGAGVVPKKSMESLVLQAAAHLDADLAMPPKENKAKAKDLTPEQLGLLKLWIDQGAKSYPRIERVVQWQPMAENLGAIFAVAVTPDGQYAACTRANRLFVYHLPTGRCVLNEAAHQDQANAIAFSPDGTLLASGGYREVKLWRRSEAKQRITVPDAGALIALSPDGQWLAAAGEDGKVKLSTWPENKAARIIEASTGALVTMKFSPDGQKLACAGADKRLTLWKVADGSALGKVESPSDIAALAWFPDGQKLAAGGADKIIRLYSDALAPGKELKGHTGPIAALDTVAPNRIASAGADGIIRLWEAEKDAPAAQVSHGAPVTTLAVRPDGLRIASVGSDNVIKLWDAAGKPVATVKGNRIIREAAEAKDRTLQVETGTVAFMKAAVATAEKAVQSAKDRITKADEAIAPKQQDVEAKKKALADVLPPKAEAEKALAALEGELKPFAEAVEAAEKAALAAKTNVETLKAAATEQAVLEKAIAEEASQTLALAKAKADRDAREAKRKEAADKLEAEKKKVATAEEGVKRAETSLVVAQTETKLAREDEPKTVVALEKAKADAETAEAVRKSAEETSKAALAVAVEAEGKPVKVLAFSPDNLLLASGGDDQLVHTWSAETGAPVDVLKGHGAPVAALAFASGGELVSAARDKAVIAWSLAVTWKQERTIGTGGPKSPLVDRVNAVAFSHDGKLLATGGGEPSRDGEIKLWDPATGQLVRELTKVHGDTVLGLEFSPDDKFLASGAADRMARVTEVATGKIARNFEGHTHHVLAVTWSPDARTLATAGADNMVKTWDLLTGERKKNIEGYDKEVTAVHFAGVTPNLLTSSGDSKVRLVTAEGGQVRFFPEVADFMHSAAVTADGKIIVAGGQDGVLRVWNAADGAKLRVFEAEKK